MKEKLLRKQEWTLKCRDQSCKANLYEPKSSVMSWNTVRGCYRCLSLIRMLMLLTSSFPPLQVVQLIKLIPGRSCLVIIQQYSSQSLLFPLLNPLKYQKCLNIRSLKRNNNQMIRRSFFRQGGVCDSMLNKQLLFYIKLMFICKF